MTKSPFFNFLCGLFFGACLATAATVHILTKQVEAHVARSTANLQSEANGERAEILALTSDAWRGRAESCEAKLRNATVVYEYRPSTNVPLFHGVFSMSLGSAGNHPAGDEKAVLVVPAQVPIYSALPGTSYEWIDGKTGAAVSARMPATLPPTEQ